MTGSVSVQYEEAGPAAGTGARGCPRCRDGWPDVMTAAEVALYLRLPYLQVLALSRAGRLPGWQVGRQWRYSRRCLDQHLAANGTTRAGAVTT